jgi:ABC-type Mn2+/Zn2+ transport system ATPase subunit
MNTIESLITLDHATLGYGRSPVLRDVCLQVSAGDYLGIVGPNGSGKTTLLKAVLGLIPPLAGSVRLSHALGTVGYVPQRDTLDSIFPLTVFDIVVMGLFDTLPPVRRPGAAERERAMAALADAGIQNLADKHYGSLSGGQKQRTIIARAMVAQPEVLLLDEPTNGMDLAAEESILALIRHLHDEHRITVLLVSHLLNTVINHAHRIAFVTDGSVEVVRREEVVGTSRLADIYGLPVVVTQLGERYVVLPHGDGRPVEQ